MSAIGLLIIIKFFLLVCIVITACIKITKFAVIETCVLLKPQPFCNELMNPFSVLMRIKNT